MWYYFFIRLQEYVWRFGLYLHKADVKKLHKCFSFYHLRHNTQRKIALENVVAKCFKYKNKILYMFLYKVLFDAWPKSLYGMEK